MALDPDKLEKPLNSLRKLLKKLPKQPSPEQVHDVRTRTRRVEATLHALQLDRKRRGKRALEAVAPVRRRAGKVRDMDVLMGFAATLSGDHDQDCLVQLLEHLGQQRFRGARKLHSTTAKRRGVAARSLKRCSSTIERKFNRKGRSQWPADAAAAALQLSGELANWPRLNKNNLHPFRLKVKELRYTLQLSGQNGQLLDELDEVKDKIGEWHDWTELALIAEDVLDHQAGGCDVLEQIRSGAKLRFDQAMALANRLRQQYFASPGAKNKRNGGPLRVKEPVLKATATLAA